jgi:HlyD family secretion protein
MHAKLALPVLAVSIVLAGGAGIWWWQKQRASAPADTLVLHGNVDIRQVELAFNASDRIDQLLVQEGSRVSKGQLLAVLDTRRLEQAVAQARAQVAAQRQVVARLQAGSRPEEIRKARADVEATRADAINAEQTFRRTQELVAERFVAQQQADNAKAALDAAQARLKAAEEALQLVLLGPRREDIAAARATLEAYQAASALAQRQLAEGSLYAPADGVIEKRILEPGDMASPQKPAVTLSLTDPLWVRAYVAEPDLGKLRIGSQAQVTTDSYPGKNYRAWVGYISPTAEFTPKSVETREVRTALVYQVRVFVCAPDDELRLGMPATVAVPLGQTPSARSQPGADRCRNSP